MCGGVCGAPGIPGAPGHALFLLLRGSRPGWQCPSLLHQLCVPQGRPEVGSWKHSPLAEPWSSALNTSEEHAWSPPLWAQGCTALHLVKQEATDRPCGAPRKCSCTWKGRSLQGRPRAGSLSPPKVVSDALPCPGTQRQASRCSADTDQDQDQDVLVSEVG